MTALHPVLQHHLVNSLGWQDLRPLQREAVEPIMGGLDVLLLAPTAGGKTEAAVLPLLSRMAAEDWPTISVLYVCPLRALLNNLEPRLASYCAWLGRRVAIRHGDSTAGERRRVSLNRPDILLTTPESLEAMLVSTLVSPRELFGELRVVIVDEIHSFAGDDRGWHLLSVLERVSRMAGRPLQKIGLSATVGNPEALLEWLQGSERRRSRRVVAPSTDSSAGPPDVQLDYVGNVANAATVIAALHRGEKRLVFADARRVVEELAVNLRAAGVETFVSHSSLAVDERRLAERAFAEARDCVIVSTSTLELGVDVGDLDRVIQVGAPTTVASFLQRLGRTGRRPGTLRNTLFLATSEDELLQAASICLLWSEGFVEPTEPPPAPRHILAHQLMALCLQEGRIGMHTWGEWLGDLHLAPDAEVEEILAWVISSGYLDLDDDMLFIGQAAERRFGRRNFMELLSVFTANPEFAVYEGRDEIGSVDFVVLARRVDGPRVLQLAGRSWLVTHIDWRRRRVFVEAAKVGGRSSWSGLPRPLSYPVTDGIRRVLLGSDPPWVVHSKRASTRIARIRATEPALVSAQASVVAPGLDGQMRWWTWAGARANATVAAAIDRVAPFVLDRADRYDNRYLKLLGGTTGTLSAAVQDARRSIEKPTWGDVDVSAEAVSQLKFGDLLPSALARATLAIRATDLDGALRVLTQSARLEIVSARHP